MATPVYASEYVSVAKDGANVRTGPGTDSPVYMELFEGYPLKVVNKQGEWLEISDYEGDSGWIHTSLIGKNNTVIVNAQKSVNMRSGPNTQSPVVADVERGVIMTKISENGQWIQVKHSTGTIGWIFKSLLWP
jgi:SH3-like domain-containing protein